MKGLEELSNCISDFDSVIENKINTLNRMKEENRKLVFKIDKVYFDLNNLLVKTFGLKIDEFRYNKPNENKETTQLQLHLLLVPTTNSKFKFLKRSCSSDKFFDKLNDKANKMIEKISKFGFDDMTYVYINSLSLESEEDNRIICDIYFNL